MKVAVLGFGTVGKGVWEMLQNAEGLEPGKILVRPGKETEAFMVSSIDEIVSDPEIGAVAEVMGGIEPAFTYCSKALSAGKNVVTSNKALVSEKGPELEAIAQANGCAFLFSAACGGGIPFLHNLSLAVKSDRIISLGGILNGTTNFMLDLMQSEKLGYAPALAEAQRLGYAEADPTADVSGLDALRKIMLACAVAYNRLPVSGLLNEGIENITLSDIEDFMSRGYVCRLLTGASYDGERLSAYVEPVLVRSSAPESSVKKNFNLANYIGQCSGSITMIGQGAGRYPTASAVIRDLSSVLLGSRYMLRPDCERVSADNSAVSHKYYLRLPSGCSIPFAHSLLSNVEGVSRIVTEPVSVADLHAAVSELRVAGNKVFFAELRD